MDTDESEPALTLENGHIQLTFNNRTQLLTFEDNDSGTSWLVPPSAQSSWWSLQALVAGRSERSLVDLTTPCPFVSYGVQTDPASGRKNATFIYQDIVLATTDDDDAGAPLATLDLRIDICLTHSARHVELWVYAAVGKSSPTQQIGLEWFRFNLHNINTQAYQGVRRDFADLNDHDGSNDGAFSDLLVWPEGYGMQTTAPTVTLAKGFEGWYPSSDAAYQLIMYYFDGNKTALNLSNGPGIQVGSFDGDANTKLFRFEPTNGFASKSFDLQVRLIPQAAGHTMDSRACIDPSHGCRTLFSYSTFWGVFVGDWYDGSELYMNWVRENAVWTQAGNIRDRSDVADWVRDMNIWINTGWQKLDIFNKTEGDPEVVLERVSKVVERLNLPSPLGLHWYEWQTAGRFDTKYPDYFPAKDGFSEVVRKLQSINVRIAPYINGRIYDVDIPRWKQDDAENFACKDLPPDSKLNSTDYDLYIETYGSGSTFAVMCPATAYWQKVITVISGQCAEQYGVDGIYIDQIGAAAPKLCNDVSHDHLPAGGNYWSSGYWRMLSEVRSAMDATATSRPHMILTESNAEPYMHLLNFYLTLVAFAVNISGKLISMVPVFPRIYGGLFIGMGAMYYQTDLDPNPDVFAAKVGWQLLNGAQIGWFSLAGTNDEPRMGLYDFLITDDRYENEIELLRRLDAYRSVAKEHLVYGRRVRDVPFRYKINGTELTGDERLAHVDYEWPPSHSHGTDSFTSLLSSRSPRRLTYDHILTSTWISQPSDPNVGPSFGLFFFNVDRFAPVYAYSWAMNLFDFGLAHGSPWSEGPWQVNWVNPDGSKGRCGIDRAILIGCGYAPIQPREIKYVTISPWSPTP